MCSADHTEILHRSWQYNYIVVGWICYGQEHYKLSLDFTGQAATKHQMRLEISPFKKYLHHLLRLLFSWQKTTNTKHANTNFRTKSCSMDTLTHWGRVTHICVSDLTIVGSDSGLSPGRRQAIIRNNAGILLIRPLGTNFSEILTEFLLFSFKKMRLKVSSGKWRPFCLGLNVLNEKQWFAWGNLIVANYCYSNSTASEIENKSHFCCHVQVFIGWYFEKQFIRIYFVVEFSYIYGI